MMNHPMRRKDRQLDSAAIQDILNANEYGVLSTVDADGCPYGVPLTYVYLDHKIYFHCAPEGHKLKNIAANPKASFCVVGKTELLPEQFATKYESVIAFGRMQELTGNEKTEALRKIVARYSADFAQKGEVYIAAMQDKARVFCLEIEQITGKARR